MSFSASSVEVVPPDETPCRFRPNLTCSYVARAAMRLNPVDASIRLRV
jgi:hypothetical protein